MEHLIALAIITVPLCIWLMRRCRHKFTLVDKVRIVDDFEVCVGAKYVLQCEHCGKIKFAHR